MPTEMVSSPALPEVIARYLHGESLQTLAAECGITKPGLRKRIIRYCLTGEGDHEYTQLVTDVLAERIAQADVELEDSVDAVSIARARETARFARMDFERRRPHLYGQKSGESGTKILVVVSRESAASERQLLDAPTPTSSGPSGNGGETE